jgi:hypothetical protein
MPPANGFRREIFAPRRAGIRHHHPRFGMESADGVQGGVEKFRRIEMRNAESQRSFVRRLNSACQFNPKSNRFSKAG